MNVPTITMPKEKAAEAYQEYRSQVREPTPEDLAIMEGYQQLAKGNVLLDLKTALAAGGLDELQRPKLAIGRASWQWVQLERRWTGLPKFSKWPFAKRGPNPAVLIPRGTFTTPVADRGWRAMLPLIPPSIRPAAQSLSRYHVLWEADWQAAPVDPILLRRLGHANLYVVLAAWAMTELERTILGAIRTEEQPEAHRK